MPDQSLVTSARHVFVYGTLRRGQRNDISRIAADQEAPVLIGFASIEGTMFDLGEYPGVILGTQASGAGRIVGEVYRVDAAVEVLLDVLEELLPEPTGEYSKREIEVQLSPSPESPAVQPHPIECFVYEINPDRVRCAKVIESGDWSEYDASKG